MDHSLDTRQPCRLSLVGGFGLHHGADPLPTKESGARILAYLALHGRGRPVARTALADRLYADPDPTRSAARLRSALWRLPRVAGRPVVKGAPSTVELAAFVDVDVWLAETTARELTEIQPAGDVPAPPRSVREAVGWARFDADLLPDWTEDWLVLERESFRQVRLHALERVSSQLRRAGSHEAALQAALTAVACEPLRETAHRRVIEAHLAEGNHAEALRQYDAYRRLLSAELGLAPTNAIRELVGPLLGRPADIVSVQNTRTVRPTGAGRRGGRP